MNQFDEFDDLLKTYHRLNIIQSKDEFDKTKIEFVYHSNRLEGSNLTLFQTEDIINSHHIKGEASFLECLMAIDNYRALNLALTFGVNKYPLTEKMLLNFHQTLLKNSFENDPAYASWKDKGQLLGEFKVGSNRIRRTEGGKDVYYPTPTVIESKENILKSLELYNFSSEHFLEKLSKLSDEYKIDLPKGASRTVIENAKKFVDMYGKELLRKVAKLHFKITTEVVNK